MNQETDTKEIKKENTIKNEENLKKIILSTTEMANKEYEILGIVSGSNILTKNIVKDVGQGLKSMVGGRLRSYEKMLRSTRELAMKQMVEEARALNADAVVAVKQSTSEIATGASEVSIFGTAVKFK